MMMRSRLPVALALLTTCGLVACDSEDGFPLDGIIAEGEGETTVNATKSFSVHVDSAQPFAQVFRVQLENNELFFDGTYQVNVTSSNDIVQLALANDEANATLQLQDADPGVLFFVGADANFDGVQDPVFVAIAPSPSALVPVDAELQIFYSGFGFGGAVDVPLFAALEPRPLVPLN